MIKKFKVKKVVVSLLLFIALVFAGFSFKDRFYVYFYLSPECNTSVFPYIAKTTTELDAIYSEVIKNLNAKGYNIKLKKSCPCGSGFIKNNVTPSDLDTFVSVYLGEFEHNQDGIKDILYLARMFPSEVASYVNNNNTSFHVSYGYEKYLLNIDKDKDKTVKFLSNAMEKALTGEPYDLPHGNYLYTLDSYQLPLPVSSFLKLYSKDVNYSKDTKKFLREVTALIIYSADIKDSETGKTRTVYFLPLSGPVMPENGQEMIFLQCPYSKMSLSELVSNLFKKWSDEDFFEWRLSAYYLHYLAPQSIYGNSSKSPLKIVKRAIQISDILSPIIPGELRDEIQRYSYENLSNPTIAIINDYYIANSILIELTDTLKNTEYMQELISAHISDMEIILFDMIKDPYIDYSDLKPLLKYQKELLNNRSDMKALRACIKAKSPTIQAYMNKLMSNKITHKERFVVYMKYFNGIMDQAGMHHVTLYDYLPKNIYVSSYTYQRKLKEDEFNQIKLQSGLMIVPNMQTAKIKLGKPAEKREVKPYLYWFRYKPTQMEEVAMDNMKRQLATDKKRFKVRVRAGLIKK